MAWMKRIASPFARERKSGGKFVTAVRGPYPKDESIPLLTVVRDMLKIAEVRKEAKRIIKSGAVLIDGRQCKDEKFGVGLMCVISLPLIKKSYRVIQTAKGLELVEIQKSMFKPCKIINKTAVKGGKIQYNFYGGGNLLADNSYKVGDTLVLRLPENKIEKHLPMAEGADALVFRGKNRGRTGKIKKIEGKSVWLEHNGETFEVPKDFIIVVGEDWLS